MVPSDHIARSTMATLASISIELAVSLSSPSRCCLHVKSGLYTADLDRTANRSSTRVPSALIHHALVVRFALQSLMCSLTESAHPQPAIHYVWLCCSRLRRAASDSIFHVHFYSLEDWFMSALTWARPCVGARYFVSRTVPLDVLPNVPEIPVVSDPLTHVRVVTCPTTSERQAVIQHWLHCVTSGETPFRSIPVRVCRLLSERKSMMHAPDVFVSSSLLRIARPWSHSTLDTVTNQLTLEMWTGPFHWTLASTSKETWELCDRLGHLRCSAQYGKTFVWRVLSPWNDTTLSRLDPHTTVSPCTVSEVHSQEDDVGDETGTARNKDILCLERDSTVPEHVISKIMTGDALFLQPPGIRISFGCFHDLDHLCLSGEVSFPCWPRSLTLARTHQASTLWLWNLWIWKPWATMFLRWVSPQERASGPRLRRRNRPVHARIGNPASVFREMHVAPRIHQEHNNPSWLYWHPSRSSPSIGRVASVQLPKSLPVVLQVLRVSQTVLLLVTSMAHMNRCPLSITVN